MSALEYLHYYHVCIIIIISFSNIKVITNTRIV